MKNPLGSSLKECVQKERKKEKLGKKYKKENDQMEKDKKKKSQPKQPKPKSIDVEVGSVKSLCADYLNQLDASEAIYEGGEEASATKKRTVDMTKDKRTSFGLFDLPSDAPSDDPENDDLTSVTPSEAEGAPLQFSPPLEQVQRCQATRDSIARLLREKKDDDVEKEKLYGKIGQLQVEKDFLNFVWGK